MERSEFIAIHSLPPSTMEAGLASPTMSMPGSFWPSHPHRPVQLSLSTNQPSAPSRPLSTLSTDSVYYSPQGTLSPVSVYSNRSFSAADADDDLHSDFLVLESLRKDVRTNLRLRPLNLPSRCNTPATDSMDLTTALSSPLFSHSPQTTPSSPISSEAPQMSPTPPPPLIPQTDPRFGAIAPAELASMLAASEGSDLMILDIRPPPSHSLERICGSINLIVPSLMLKRFRKAGSLCSLDTLNPYISESSRGDWERKMENQDGTPWPGK